MIRREVAARDASPAAWILISQIEHARLAYDLAEAWGNDLFASLVPRRELLWAVEHHDDGWLAWDQSPRVHPQTGAPRTFTEMEPAESLAIWTGSIEAAAAVGPLEAYLVAGHFCALGHRAAGHDPAWTQTADFLARYEAKADAWLAQWQAADPVAHTRPVAEQALRWLQFFDSFSLWFCCDESTSRETIETPAAPDFTITPRTPYDLVLSPWPFREPRLKLEATGRSVPAIPYATREDLAAADSKPMILRWKLEPAARHEKGVRNLY